MAKEFKVVGKRGLGRIDCDGKDKATGKAVYARDVMFPNMLYAKFIFCPYAHAKIKSMDTSKAEALSGVRAIIRYDDPDLPENFDQVILPGDLLEPNRGVPTWILGDEGYYEGVLMGAAVAADSIEICDEALKLIDIEWEELPFILDTDEALESGADIIYPFIEEKTTSLTDFTCTDLRQEGNVRKRVLYDEGDIDEGFKQADNVIEFELKRAELTTMDPMCHFSAVKWEGDNVEVWMKDSTPGKGWVQVGGSYGMPAGDGGRLGIPSENITLSQAYQGATLGGWDWETTMFHSLNPLTVLLAKKTGRPVKALWGRREEFGHGCTDWGTFRFKVGFKDNGKITAVEMNNDFVNSIETNNHACMIAGSLHLNTSIPNIHVDAKAAWTNHHGTGAHRSEQKTSCTIINSIFSHVAAELEMDPTELAIINEGYHGHDKAHFEELKLAIGLPDRDSLKECLEMGKAAIDWDNKWHAPGTKILSNGKYHGIGFAWNHEWDQYDFTSRTPVPGIVGIRADGKAELIEWQGDIGVAHRTACCMVIAEEVGIRFEDVTCKHQYYPLDYLGIEFGAAGASFTFGYNMRWIFAPARRLKQQILERATSAITVPMLWGMTTEISPVFPDMKPEDLDIEDSEVFVKADPSNRKTITEVMQGVGMVNDAEEVPPELWADIPAVASDDQVDMPGRQCHFCEVEVDPETGAVDITNVACVNDSGFTVCPEGFEGQQYGGAIQGLGWGLLEEIIYDPPTGVILNSNLYDYHCPMLTEFGPITTLSPETGLGYNPYGCMGVGEDNADMYPSLPLDAIYNAIGKWVDLPATPDKILKALGKA